MNALKKISFEAFFLLTLAVGITPKAHAQQVVNSLSVVPPSFEVSTKRGEVINKTIRIDNLADKPVQVTVDKRNFTAQGEEGDVNLTHEESSFSLASWIEVTPSKATIPAKSSQTFQYSIRVPTDAEPGGHFGSIIFATIPDKNLTQTGASFSQEVGSLILAEVAGDVKESAQIESFYAERNFYEAGPVQFIGRIKNLGNVHIKPKGFIEITDLLGRKTRVPFEERNVLPDAIRKMTGRWDQNFLIGRYTATLFLTYGTGNQRMIASAQFYAFPVKYGLIVLGILVVLWLIRKRLMLAAKVLVGKQPK